MYINNIAEPLRYVVLRWAVHLCLGGVGPQLVLHGPDDARDHAGFGTEHERQLLAVRPSPAPPYRLLGLVLDEPKDVRRRPHHAATLSSRLGGWGGKI